MSAMPKPAATPADVIADWFISPEFSYTTTREAAAGRLLALLDANGYCVVKKRRRSFYLTFADRNAAIRAYNTRNKTTLARGEMIDAIVDAINDEHAGV